MKSKVSVIVPTYNEEKVIRECLESLVKQSYKNFEIIVVNDGSVDKTLKILSEFQIPDSRFQILEQEHKGPGAARNLGVKHATGEILVFVDADMTFDKDFIKMLITPIITRKSKGTFSKDEYVVNTDNIWSRCWGINEGWERGKKHPVNYPNTQKVFRAILKKEFDRVDGFSLTGYTDDWTLSEKLGYEAEETPGALFYHRNPDTLNEVFEHAKWIGKRKYKLGVLGQLVAIVRATLPVSLIVGFAKAIRYKTPKFIIFKSVYDFGIFIGAITFLFGGRNAK